jgi:hypothetical protein
MGELIMKKRAVRTVRCDEQGLFVLYLGNRYRPGDVAGYALHYLMDAAGAGVGNRLLVSPGQTVDLLLISTAQGVTRVWHCKEASA